MPMQERKLNELKQGQLFNLGDKAWVLYRAPSIGSTGSLVVQVQEKRAGIVVDYIHTFVLPPEMVVLAQVPLESKWVDTPILDIKHNMEFQYEGVDYTALSDATWGSLGVSVRLEFCKAGGGVRTIHKTESPVYTMVKRRVRASDCA